MQSTGHSSPQPLSLTSMHGSAITYVMGAPPPSVSCLRRAGPCAGGPGCWLGGLLAADARHLHLRPHRLRAGSLAGAQLGVAVGPPGPDGADQLMQRLVTGACAQRAAQVVPGPGEQAGEQLAAR